MKLYKRMQKRFALTVVAATTLASVNAPVFAADYDGHWAADAIVEWKDKGVIGGYEDGTFRPKQEVTRAELAAMLVRVFGFTETKGAETFSDVNESNWYAADVAKVSAAGIMYTSGKNFRPNSPATREEAAYAIAKAYKVSGSTSRTFEDQANISDWAEDEITALVAGGYISGRPDGTFAPKDTLTRADMVTMIDKVTAELFNQAGEYNKNVVGNAVINTKDVVLKDMTIDGNLYIAEGVGDGDVTLENVVVKGEVFVEGGGINSIKLKGNTSLKKVTVDKANGDVRIVTSGDAKVENVNVASGIRLEGNFENVVVANKVSVNVLGNSTIGNLIVSKAAAGSTVELAAGVTVTEATLEGKVSITGSGKIVTVILGADVKIGEVSIKVTIDKVVDSTGKDVTSDVTSDVTTGSGSGSGSNTGTTVVSSYRVQGQLTMDGKAIDYGNSTYYGTVELISYDVDGSNTRTIVKADSQGRFDFGQLAKGKTYRVRAFYDVNEREYSSETYLIENLKSNESIPLELNKLEPIVIYGAEVTTSGQIVVRTNHVKDLRASIAHDDFNGMYRLEWKYDGDQQITTITLPKGKELEKDKEYTLVLYREYLRAYEVKVKWASEVPGQPEQPEQPEAVITDWDVSTGSMIVASLDEIKNMKTTSAAITVKDGSTITAAIQWNAADLAKITTTGTYQVVGKLVTSAGVANGVTIEQKFEWTITTTAAVNSKGQYLLEIKKVTA